MKTFQGIITSLKTAQTARVKVDRSWQHPMYQKFVTRSKNYACHYQDLELTEGDTVVIEECRPLSKTKHFKIVEKLKSAPQVAVLEPAIKPELVKATKAKTVVTSVKAKTKAKKVEVKS